MSSNAVPPPSPVVNTRPEVLFGQTIRVESPFGTVFVTLNENGSRQPFEIFLNIGKCGSDATADAEAIGRLCSLFLRIPSSVPEVDRLASIIQHLEGIGGSRRVKSEKGRIRSIPDAVAVALRFYLQNRSSYLPGEKE